MSQSDFAEWLTLMLVLPLAAFATFFWLLTALYVYIDTEQRTKSRLLAAGFALMVATYYWPISFLAYLACTAVVDRRQSKCRAGS